MSASSDHPLSCPQCGAALPAKATDGLCPRCLLSQAMRLPSEEPEKPKKAAVPLPEELAPHFPNYEILRILGRGGMGAVYLARQTSLNRLVAIKILPSELDDGENNFTQRFKNEAQAMAQLSHPGIVAVYDFGQTTSGLRYIVMEYIDGTDVALMVERQGRLPSAHAMAITAHVCDALAYAHGKGIIHRDIKPSNIMIGNDGVVKVADFGLARMSQTAQSGLTQSGMVMGTLHFMAPEALMLGTAVDQRADIYAVGVMLYQMLTGKLPQGLFEMPSLQVKGLDPRYDGIVAKALREDRELRYASAVELRHDLDAILTQPVARVEASAKEAPAALITQARPKRPDWQPPQPGRTPPLQRAARSSPYKALLLLTLCVAAGWIYWQQSGYRFVVEPTPSEEQQEGQTNPANPAASKESPFVNTLGMNFVPVPGTKVLFCIHETRRQDYAAYAAETPGINGDWKNQSHDGYTLAERNEEHPVTQVSWEDAQGFCAWLSKKEGKTYRLPRDREWSYAVGIGQDEKWDKDSTPATLNKSQTDFPWGDQWPPPKGSGNFSDDSRKAKAPKAAAQYLENYDDGFPTTAPVMSFKPNKLGLYDLEGNVREWVEDWYDNVQKYRVLRGGCWYNHELDDRPMLLSSARGYNPPGNRKYYHGFRVVLADDAAQPSSVPAPSGLAQSAASGDSGIQGSPGTTVPIPPSLPPPATKDKPFINTLGMNFVPVPIGGGPSKGQAVLFSIWDTRVQDYGAYATAKPGVDGAWRIQQRDGAPIAREPDHPVVGVSWEDAQRFCQWLTEKENTEGKLPKGLVYRLPSDEEWSWAAGLPQEEGLTPREKHTKNSVDFPWGKDWPPPNKVGNYADETFHAKFPTDWPDKRKDQPWIKNYTDGYAATSPVGSFPANAHGLYDMGGNVWQWCEDWVDNERIWRVLRGRAWVNFDRDTLLLSKRQFITPRARTNDVGFRCVLSAASIAAQAIGTSDTTMSKAAATKSAAKAAPATNATSADTVSLPSGPTTWTDVKGRSLVATFKSIQGDAVLLEIAGKTQPVALATLSEGSQKLARAYQSHAGPMAATKDTPFINTLDMKFVPVPGTKVLFCIHETRRQDYAAYATSVPGVNDSWKNQQKDGIPCGDKDDHPVVGVSWEDAMKFCEWLSKKDGKTYRLPTDEEWSIAVGLGDKEKQGTGTTPEMLGGKETTLFPWGGDYPPRRSDNAGNYADSAWLEKFPTESGLKSYSDGFPTTAPVMSFKPNKLGLYDMGGNVWEWLDGWWNSSHQAHVQRGASFAYHTSNLLLSSCRVRSTIGHYAYNSGFRVVLVDSAAQSAAPGNSTRAESSGGATTNSKGQVTQSATSGAAPPPAPLLSSTGISSAVDAIKQSETDRKRCLKRLLALSEQTKGVYSFKLQNEIRHYAVDLDRTAELAACNEIFANERMQPYIISILDGTLAPGQKNAPAKNATQAKQVALEARAFPFVRAACWLRAGELLSGLGRFDEATASYKHVLEMPDEKLNAYKELARIRLEELPK